MKNLRLAIIISSLTLFGSILGGCAKIAHNSPQVSAADYLQLAERAQGQERVNYQLSAVDAYLSSRKMTLAQNLLNQIPKQNLPKNLANKRELQEINIALLQQHDDQALQALNAINRQAITTPENIKQYYSLYAEAYLQKGDIINVVNVRTQLANYLQTTSEKKKNLWLIWQAVQTLDLEQLQSDAEQTPDNNLHGWLTLTSLTKIWESQPDQLFAKLEQWQDANPNHPAIALLPKKLRDTGFYNPPEKIALLVPLSGKLASYGQAIRNGFFTAYYDQKARLDLAPTISVYDTNKDDITTTYKKALSDGANLIVGPLQKQNILTLANHQNFTVPTLSLNSDVALSHQKFDNLFTFGLSPIDEAQQAATYALETHHQRVIVIAKDDDWSKSLVNAFEKQWQLLGGNVVDTKWYQHQNKLSADIQDVLHVQQAFKSKKNLQQILNEPIRYIPRRRKDFDSIFLVASPQSAKQILPLLHFYFVNNIPVFSTSQIYLNTKTAKYNRDLDGVFFCDLPWIINAQNLQPNRLEKLHDHINALWPNDSKKYARFYALGIDAFDLVHKLNKLIMLPELSTPGATGTLTLTPSQHIYRELPWAVIQKGHAQLVNS